MYSDVNLEFSIPRVTATRYVVSLTSSQPYFRPPFYSHQEWWLEVGLGTRLLEGGQGTRLLEGGQGTRLLEGGQGTRLLEGGQGTRPLYSVTTTTVFALSSLKSEGC